MENKTSVACDVTEGSLPGACASMVFPYVAMQGENPQRYNQKDALAVGDAFSRPAPALFLKRPRNACSGNNTALCELMALEFAINELGLYLDTHRNDKEACSSIPTM